MKFLALCKKEFREAMPWLVVAAVAFGLLGGVLLHGVARVMPLRGWRHQPGAVLNDWAMLQPCPLAMHGGWLLAASLALGLVLAGRQFWMPAVTRTWAFTLHRSVPRWWILAAKLLVAAAGMAASLGVVWTLVFLYAGRPGLLPYPPRPRVLGEGWFLILMGLIAYLGAALPALERTRWYTTRLFGLAFAAGVIAVALGLPGAALRWGAVVIGLLVLGSQLLRRFLAGEF